MSDSKQREHICFTGYVQGVGFRYRALYAARGLGLTGWVQNLWDGRVEMNMMDRSVPNYRGLSERLIRLSSS